MFTDISVYYRREIFLRKMNRLQNNIFSTILFTYIHAIEVGAKFLTIEKEVIIELK